MLPRGFFFFAKDAVFVFDGGSLLQRLPWPSHSTYADIASIYVQFVTRHYGEAVVVFDGYESGPSTKDETHQRREGKYSYGPEVNFKPNMKITMKKKGLPCKPPKQAEVSVFPGQGDGKCWYRGPP